MWKELFGIYQINISSIPESDPVITNGKEALTGNLRRLFADGFAEAAFNPGFFAAHPVFERHLSANSVFIHETKDRCIMTLATVASFTNRPHSNKNKEQSNGFKSITAMPRILPPDIRHRRTIIGTCRKSSVLLAEAMKPDCLLDRRSRSGDSRGRPKAWAAMLQHARY
ncbi:hypothetical protein EJA97_00020 [Pseudomonas aeruginosa]|nr:hypothetical protein [Pseudomonas aeruginosa]AZN11795.1 hypothetical protein EJA97_00020 [Pseudomonas aeruginosa]